MTRAIIVNDNQHQLDVLQSNLRKSGWEVDAAHHGVEALVMARLDPPDLIISDLFMPVMDGYTLLRTWKSDDTLRHIPFVVCTATYTDPFDEQLALDLGADAFMLEPPDMESFVEQMREVVVNAALGARLPVDELAIPKEVQLKAYSEVLVRKLQAKRVQVEEANRALEEREQQLSMALRAAHMTTWAWDVGSGAMEWSAGSEELWGADASKLPSSQAQFEAHVHPDDRVALQQALHQCLRTRTLCNHEFRIMRLDGATRWIAVRARPSQDEANRRARMAGVMMDIHELRELGEQLKQAQKMEAIGQLAGGVAHDFNNVLTAIMGNAEMAERDLAPGRVQAQTPLEHVREIIRASRRAKHLVQQILAFSRKQSTERRVIQLQPTVEESVSLLRAVLPASVELQLHCLHDTPNVEADSNRIQQALMNLCTNAAQAMAGGGGHIVIRLEAVALQAELPVARGGRLRPGRYARLSVRDDGRGMDQGTLARAFEPFFTTKDAGQGSGLGLSVVDNLVKSHDGGIAISSEPGLGSTFALYFPAVDAPAVVARAPLAPAPHEAYAQRPRILYVDDEEPLVRLASKMFKALGYEVRGFTRAAQALDAFRAEPNSFDLAVTDFTMPETTGLKFAADLLAVRPELPIILTSGYVTDELKERARRAGVRSIASKPMSMREFDEAIDAALREPHLV